MVRGGRVVAVAAVLGIALATPAAAQAADQAYHWKWSDGSTATTRTFTQAKYGLPSNLPRIVVTAEPASPAREVYLQFRRNGRWTTEARARTNSAGIATIAVDPMCGDEWCETTFSYRLVAGEQHANLAIRFAEQ
jgi:hypothetical protein